MSFGIAIKPSHWVTVKRILNYLDEDALVEIALYIEDRILRLRGLALPPPGHDEQAAEQSQASRPNVIEESPQAVQGTTQDGLNEQLELPLHQPCTRED